jgi:predicted dehydrogenase
MEKPLTTRPDEGRKLLSAARHAGKILAVIAQNRFSDGALSLKASLEAGLLGKIIIARASVKWFRDDKYYLGSDWRGRRDGEGGGVLMNQAIHSTDMLIHLLGRPQAVVAMCARNRDIIDTEDAATVVLSFPRKVVASMEASTSTWPGFEESYEIHGNAGYATLARGVLTQFATRSGEPAVPPPAQKPPTVDDGKLVLFQRQYWNIYEAMENGPDRLLVTPEESLWVVETTHQMYETASQLSSETLSL